MSNFSLRTHKGFFPKIFLKIIQSMSLRIKTLLIVVLISVALIYFLYLVTSSIILNSYSNLEKKDSYDIINRAIEAYSADIEYLHSKSGDWANWDDMYDYVKKPNQKFVFTNITKDTFKQLNINLILIADNNGKILAAEDYDSSSQQLIPLPQWWFQTITIEHKLLQHDENSDTTGLILINNKPMMVSIRPILTSNAAGPVAGTIIFGKYLDRKTTAELIGRIKYYVSFIPYSQGAAELKTSHQQLSGTNKIIILPHNEKILIGYALINDIYGQPAFILKEELPRNIYGSGIESIKVFTVILGIFCIMLIILIMLMLETGILRRLYKLTKEIKIIGKKGLLSAKVSNFGSDELGILANTFNRTLNELEIVTREKVYQQSQKESLLEILGEGVIVTNKSGEIIFVNPACEKLFDYSFEELKGKHFTNCFNAFDLNEKPLPNSFLQDLKARVVQGSIIRVIRVFLQGKNRRIPVIINMAPVIVNDQHEGTIRTFYDYTPELEKQRQKDDFFSFASHELRTPLTIISSNLKVILDGYGKSNISDIDKKLLLNSVESTDRLKRLVNEFLNISRIEQGRVTYNLKKIDISLLINNICKEMNTVYSLKGLYLKNENTESNVYVIADEDKLKEIIINLLGNSLKFTQNGGITLSLTKDIKQVTIQFTDTGIGIPEDKQQYLFKKFQRGVQGMQIEGTGLGLYISRQFITGMHGNVWIEKSEEGKGTTFMLTMPLAQ